MSEQFQIPSRESLATGEHEAIRLTPEKAAIGSVAEGQARTAAVEAAMPAAEHTGETQLSRPEQIAVIGLYITRFREAETAADNSPRRAA